MSLTIDDYIPCLTIWREARGEGFTGMLAVAWVIRNRMAKRSMSAQDVCLQPMQFSSMTYHGDPETVLFPPAEADVAWDNAQTAWECDRDDPTQGADFYFANTIPPPAWAKDYTRTVQIGKHIFFKS